MTHKRSKEANVRRTQKQLARSLTYRFSHHDSERAETVWTQATTNAVYYGLKFQFGYVNMGFIRENGEVLSDSHGKGSLQSQT